MGPEKNFENKIKNFIEEQGGWQVKYFANRMTRIGIPDILACIEGYFVAVEVKSDNGKPTLLQIKKCKEIRNSNGFSFILYPSGFELFKMFIYDLKNEIYSKNLPLILK